MCFAGKRRGGLCGRSESSGEGLCLRRCRRLCCRTFAGRARWLWTTAKELSLIGGSRSRNAHRRRMQALWMQRRQPRGFQAPLLTACAHPQAIRGDGGLSPAAVDHQFFTSRTSRQTRESLGPIGQGAVWAGARARGGGGEMKTTELRGEKSFKSLRVLSVLRIVDSRSLAGCARAFLQPRRAGVGLREADQPARTIHSSSSSAS